MARLWFVPGHVCRLPAAIEAVGPLGTDGSQQCGSARAVVPVAAKI